MGGLPWRRMIPFGWVLGWTALSTVAACIAFGIGIVLSTEGATSTRLRVLAGLDRRALADPREGPAVFRGALVGPPERTTPLGKPSALWAAQVYETTGTGKSRSTKRVCHANALGGVSLRDGGVTRGIAWLEDLRFVAIVDLDVIRVVDVDTSGQLDLGEPDRSAKDVPPSMLARCNLQARPNLSYREASLPPSARVEVTGCLERGAIRTCANAPRLLASRGLRALVTPWLTGRDGVAFGALLLGGFFVAVGVVSLRSHARAHGPPFPEGRAE